MRNYVTNKLWSELEPTSPRAEWVLRTMFRFESSEIFEAKELDGGIENAVYLCQAKLDRFYDGETDHKYLNAWNSARADLIPQLVKLPFACPVYNVGGVQIEPPVGIAYWLATYLLGFNSKELKVFCPDLSGDLIPLLVCCYRQMAKMPPLKQQKEEGLELDKYLLFHYHRTRYLLLKYYLDAVYHAINQ